MNKMVVIPDEKLQEVREDLNRLVARIEDESLTDEERSRYFEEWRGYRHLLRTLGLNLLRCKTSLT